MDRKLQDEIYDVLDAIDRFFEAGAKVYPYSPNPYGIKDETMQMAVRRVLEKIRGKVA